MQTTPAQGTGKGSFFAALREALRGTEMDFTSGPLGRGILLLAVPMMLEMLGEALFALTDAFFVARLGPAALATVGMTESLLEVVYAIAVGLGMATTALVARRVGEKDRRGAAVTAVQALGVAVCLGCLLALVGVLAAPRLLRLMGADAATVAAGSSYTRWVYAGIPWVVLLFVGNAVFRGAGDASKAMRALWVANVINILLDPCLIFGLGPFPRLGLEGAAVATNIGRATGVLYLFSRLARPGPHLALTRTDLRLQTQVVRRLLRLSVGGVGQFLIATASYIGLIRVLSTFGGATLAGYVVAIRIVIFVIMPSWGLSSAAATLVGQNLGAHEDHVVDAGEPDGGCCASDRELRLRLLCLGHGDDQCLQRRRRHCHALVHQPRRLLAVPAPRGLAPLPAPGARAARGVLGHRPGLFALRGHRHGGLPARLLAPAPGLTPHRRV